MKKLVIGLVFTFSCFAQTWEVCTKKITVTKIVTQVCQIIPDEVVVSMTKAVQESINTPVPINGKANLIFNDLQNLYQSLLEKYPSVAQKKLNDAAEIAASVAVKSRLAILPVIPVTEP